MRCMTNRMLVMGLGFSGSAIAREAARRGFDVAGTMRDPAGAAADLRVVGFDGCGEVIARATHLVVTVPPGEAGDPVLLAHRDALSRAPGLRWIGYISTTGVYGDRGGAWVEETDLPAPGQPRAIRRRRVEEDWEGFAAGRLALDLFRTGGIYGPGRNALEELRGGTARRVVRPGHVFSRIHRDDIALAVVAAALAPPAPGTRVLHLVDDEPAESAAVMEEAARLLGVPPPPPQSYADAASRMSPMARSFWEESRRVASRRTKSALGIAWHHPTFREGLRAIHLGQRRHGGPEQGEVGGP